MPLYCGFRVLAYCRRLQLRRPQNIWPPSKRGWLFFLFPDRLSMKVGFLFLFLDRISLSVPRPILSEGILLSLSTRSDSQPASSHAFHIYCIFSKTLQNALLFAFFFSFVFFFIASKVCSLLFHQLSFTPTFVAVSLLQFLGEPFSATRVLSLAPLFSLCKKFLVGGMPLGRFSIALCGTLHLGALLGLERRQFRRGIRLRIRFALVFARPTISRARVPVRDTCIHNQKNFEIVQTRPRVRRKCSVCVF